MRSEELIRRYWTVRPSGVATQSGVAVKFAASGSDVLWLDIPQSDPDLAASCLNTPKLADYLLLCRCPPRRDKKSEAISDQAGPWQALVVELKSPARMYADAEKAATQIGNLAALVFGDDEWCPVPEMLGVVVYKRVEGSPSDHGAIKSEFRKKCGFPLRFVPVEEKNPSPADLTSEVQYVVQPDIGALKACRAALVARPAPPPPAPGKRGSKGGKAGKSGKRVGRR